MKKLLLPAMLTSAMLLSSCAALRDAFIVITESVHPEWTNRPPVVVTNEVPPAPAPVPEPQPPVVEQPTTPAHPFAGKRITYKACAKDILAWSETARIDKATFKGSTLRTSGHFPAWPCKEHLGGSFCGNFGLAVEQPDGSIVIGTIDWNRCGHQSTKSLGHNLAQGGEMYTSLGLRPSARIWWFTAGMCRDHVRNVKERSNFYPDTWK